MEIELINPVTLLLAFSDTIDCAAHTLASHQQRTAYIAFEMAKCAGLPKNRQAGLFLAGLFHDVGALSLEEKVALHQNLEFDLVTHSKLGHALYKSCDWLAPQADIVLNHHTDWKNWNEPISNPLVLDSQLLYLADVLERSINRDAFILHEEEALKDKILNLSGNGIAPAVVELFMEASRREEFWFDLVSENLSGLMEKRSPIRAIAPSMNAIVQFSRFVSMIVDYKSPFTSTHSVGVAHCAGKVGELAGMGKTDCQLLEVAGLLHDLGKLSLPSAIIMKPGALTVAERAVIKKHSYVTHSLLNSVSGFSKVGEWAAYHHERLDGLGYPFRPRAEEISQGARIIAVADVFTALSEDRPYRAGMGKEQTLKVLTAEAVAGAWDPEVVSLLADNYDGIHREMQELQGSAAESYRRHIERLKGQ